MTHLALPGTPPPSLRAVWEILDPATKEPLLAHLTGSTSADWLARTLGQHGHRVSATTIRQYRRQLLERGVIV